MSGPGAEYLGKEEQELVLEALASGSLNRYRFDGSGCESMVARFEGEFAARMQTSHALAMNSCTSALIAALKAMGVGPGDEVIVPCYTFVATAAAVMHVGAVPLFCDIDASLTLDPEAVAAAIGPATRAVIAVHMLGRPCAMDRLAQLCSHHGLGLIEDVAQACGASFQGRPLGSMGDAGCFSFNVFKVITAGDGGALISNDDLLYRRAFAYHDHGFMPDDLAGGDGVTVGTNLRMTELSAAVLRAQLAKLDRILATVRNQHARLLERLELPSAVRVLPSHDDQGQTGTALVLGFDSADAAQRFSRALDTRPALESGRHFYTNMEAVLSELAVRSRDDGHRHRVRGTRGDGPSAEILGRAVIIGIGVIDGYLGAGLGIRSRAGEAEVQALAERINRALATL